MIDWFGELYRIIKLISYGGTSKKLTSEFIGALNNTLTTGGGSGGGDVVGPGVAVSGNLAVFSGTTGKLIADGGAPGGGGSFLSANTARVDPSGDDDTGTVGDLSKPFLTVQAAIDAIVDLADTTTPFVIDVGVNQFEEALTIEDELVLVFAGANCDTSVPFATLTATAPLKIYAVNCALGTGGISTSALFTMYLQESRTGSITSTASGDTLTIGSYYNTGAIGEVVADDVGEIYIFGVVPAEDTSITSANATEVVLDTLKGNPLFEEYGALFSVSTPAATISATNCLLREVECALATFEDSRIIEPPVMPEPIEYRNRLLANLGYTFSYDFDRDGGQSAELWSLGEQSLPRYFVVTGATLNVTTPLDSENSLATVALGSGEAADDVVTATLVSAPPWSTENVTAIALLVKMTSFNNPSMTIAIEDLTAGAFNVNFRGYMSQ